MTLAIAILLVLGFYYVCDLLTRILATLTVIKNILSMTEKERKDFELRADDPGSWFDGRVREIFNKEK